MQKDFYNLKTKKTTINIKTDDGYDLVYDPMGACSMLELGKLQREETFLNKKIEILQKSAETVEDFDRIEKAIDQLNANQTESRKAIRNMLKGADDKSKQYLETLNENEILMLVDQINATIKDSVEEKEDDGSTVQA